MIEMGDIVYEPPRDGPTLWEIGIPDRKASEFFIPDPDPTLVNRVLVHHQDRFISYTFVNLTAWMCEKLNSTLLYYLSAGSGNMGYGRNTQICIQMMTLFTLSV